MRKKYNCPCFMSHGKDTGVKKYIHIQCVKYWSFSSIEEKDQYLVDWCMSTERFKKCPMYDEGFIDKRRSAKDALLRRTVKEFVKVNKRLLAAVNKANKKNEKR